MTKNKKPTLAGESTEPERGKKVAEERAAVFSCFSRHQVLVSDWLARDHSLVHSDLTDFEFFLMSLIVFV